VGSGLHFFIFLFCHIGWSALWLSQTVWFFKLAHNGLQAGERPTFYKIVLPKKKLNLLKLFVFEVVFGLALACC
jgi:hypothetical protein